MSTEHAPERDGAELPKLISKRQLLQIVPLSYTSIWSRMRKDEFPRSVKLDDTGAKVAWILSEVEEWIASRPRVQLKPAGEPKITEADQPEAA